MSVLMLVRHAQAKTFRGGDGDVTGGVEVDHRVRLDFGRDRKVPGRFH